MTNNSSNSNDSDEVSNLEQKWITGADPTTKINSERKKMTIKNFLLIFCMFFFCAHLLLGIFVFYHLTQVKVNSEDLAENTMPIIAQTQNNFNNINNLKIAINIVYNAYDQNFAQIAYQRTNTLVQALIKDASVGIQVEQFAQDFEGLWQQRSSLSSSRALVNEQIYTVIDRIVAVQNHVSLTQHESKVLSSYTRYLVDLMERLTHYDVQDENFYLKNKEILTTLQNMCAMHAQQAELQYCTDLLASHRQYQSQVENYQLARGEFAQSFNALSNMVEDLILKTNQHSSASIEARLIYLTDLTSVNIYLIYITSVFSALITIIAYFWLYRRIGIPLTKINDIITIFRTKKRRPRQIESSNIAEIQSIYNVLPKLFEDFSQQQQVIANQHQTYQQLLNVSYKDNLTGVRNRRALDHLIENLDEVPSNIAVLMIDIDNFKAFNDVKGHQYGDFVLSTIGRQLRASVANEDCVYRYGGEEFAIILQEVGARSLVDIGTRLCNVIYNLRIENKANPTGLLTISVGCSCATAQDGQYTMLELIAQADSALYQAKNSGRNTVVRYIPNIQKVINLNSDPQQDSGEVEYLEKNITPNEIK